MFLVAGVFCLAIISPTGLIPNNVKKDVYRGAGWSILKRVCHARFSEASGWLSRATIRFSTLAARLFIPLRFIQSDIPELADIRLRQGYLV